MKQGVVGGRAGFRGVNRAGSPGPTMDKNAKTSAETAPRFFPDKQLQARDDSGGQIWPRKEAKWTLGKMQAQGGVPVFDTTAAQVTSARSGSARNAQLPEFEKQKQQTTRLPGPGLGMGEPAPKVKRPR